MTNRAILFSVLMCWCLIPQLAVGHHSVVYTFDVTKSGTVTGVVKEVWYKNPHVRYYIAVTNENGEEEIWDTHGHNPMTLTRSGWMQNTIQVGDTVSVTGDTARDGSRLLFIRTVTLADGRVLVSAPGAENRAASR